MVSRVCFPGITTDELLQRVTIRSKRRGVGKRKVKKDKKKKGAEEEPEGEPEEEDEVEDEVTPTPLNSRSGLSIVVPATIFCGWLFGVTVASPGPKREDALTLICHVPSSQAAVPESHLSLTIFIVWWLCNFRCTRRCTRLWCRSPRSSRATTW